MGIVVNPDEVLSQDGVYRYVNIEMTTAIFSELLVLLFNNTTFDRNVAINKVLQFHRQHGGLASKLSYVYAFKHAVSNHLNGCMENIAYGQWSLSYSVSDIQAVLDDSNILIETENMDEAGVYKFNVDKELGFGDSAVYVYYYDVYKRYANVLGCDCWPCKVGMSSVDAISRVLSQSGTAYPEYPHIALLIKSDDARGLEKILHSILSFKGKHIDDAPGMEWFLSNPDEIEVIYNGLTN